MPIPQLTDGESGEDCRSSINQAIAAIGSVDEVTTGADPEAINPNTAHTILTSGGTKLTEEATLADHSGDTPFIKTIEIHFAQGADVILLTPANAAFGTLTITNPQLISDLSAIVQLCWNPDGGIWQALVGAAVMTNGKDIDTNGGDINMGTGILEMGGGDINMNGGTFSGNDIETVGEVSFSGLPTVDPAVSGYLWVEPVTNYVKRSAGP